MEIEGHTIVDGGLLSNFPIELFISDLKTVIDVMGNKTSQHVLGMLIDESLSVPGVQAIKEDISKEKFGISQLVTVQRLTSLVNTVLGARDKSVIEAFENLVARMPAQDYGTTEFDMTDERRDMLVEAGRKAMEEYFANQQQAGALAFGIEAEPDPVSKNTANKLANKMLR